MPRKCMTVRFLRVFAVFVAVIVVVSTGRPTVAETVRVLSWSRYIDLTVLNQFEIRTGNAVKYQTYDGIETLDQVMKAGGAGYDVVIGPPSVLAPYLETGAVMRLEARDLPNLRNISRSLQRTINGFDTNKTHRLRIYTVPYMWGTTGFGVNVEMLKARGVEGSSGSIIFDLDTAAKLADCGISVLEAPEEVIPLVLLSLGEDPASTDPEIIKKAGPVLAAWAPNVKFIDSKAYVERLTNGSICVALGYSGDVLQAKQKVLALRISGRSIRYDLPARGARMWADVMAIPTSSSAPAAAHQFINFLLDPEIAAQISNETRFATANAAAYEFVTDDLLDDVAVYPPKALMEKLFVARPYEGEAQQAATEVWNAFVSSVGQK